MPTTGLAPGTYIFRPYTERFAPGYSIPLFGQLSTRDAGDKPHGGLDVEQIVNDVHSGLNATRVLEIGPAGPNRRCAGGVRE